MAMMRQSKERIWTSYWHRMVSIGFVEKVTFEQKLEVVRTKPLLFVARKSNMVMSALIFSLKTVQ